MAVSTDAFARFRQLRGIVPPLSVPVQGSELNAHLAFSVPPANIPEPCPHTQGYIRVDGSCLCIACWLALAPGATAWLPEAPPVYCGSDQHQWAPTDARMPDVRQCQQCPAVERMVPTEACTPVPTAAPADRRTQKYENYQDQETTTCLSRA